MKSYLYYPENFIDSSRVFFGVDFFRQPPPDGFSIEWTSACSYSYMNYGYCSVVHDHKPCHENCMKGVIVKFADPKRVWVLTGNADTEKIGHIGKTGHIINLLHGYESVWPD